MKWQKILSKIKVLDRVSISRKPESQAKMSIVLKGDVDVTGPKIKEIYELLK